MSEQGQPPEEQLPDENIQTGETPKPLVNEKETLNTTTEIENMEVHKHPHHVTHTKKWFEYILEFTMLFLAVFLGFVAENIRESRVEKHHEHQYIKELIQDLTTDTTLLNKQIKRNLIKQSMCDSLLIMRNADLVNSENIKKVYTYFGKGLGYYIFTPSDATITQLKNGGALRLIKKSVSDSIISYDYYNKEIVRHNELYLKTYNDYWNEAYNILDVSVFRDSSYRQQPDFGLLGIENEILWKNKNLPTISTDKKDQQRFFGHLFRLLGINDFSRYYMINQKHRAERLIGFLNKEYPNE